MDKKKKIIIIILIFTILLLGVGVVKFDSLFKGPSVDKDTKEKVSSFAIEYLTKKYGDYKFTIKSIEYDFHMSTLFDYSNPVGYIVCFYSNYLNCVSYLSIKGLEIDELEVTHDDLIYNYRKERSIRGGSKKISRLDHFKFNTKRKTYDDMSQTSMVRIAVTLNN